MRPAFWPYMMESVSLGCRGFTPMWLVSVFSRELSLLYMYCGWLQVKRCAFPEYKELGANDGERKVKSLHLRQFLKWCKFFWVFHPQSWWYHPSLQANICSQAASPSFRLDCKLSRCRLRHTVVIVVWGHVLQRLREWRMSCKFVWLMFQVVVTCWIFWSLIQGRWGCTVYSNWFLAARVRLP